MLHIKAIKLNLISILWAAIIAVISGIIPVIVAINVEKLISTTSSKQYILTYTIILIQSFLHRLQEFQLHQIKAKIYPMAMLEFNQKNKEPEHLNNIASFISNFWPMCFFIKNLTLIISIILIISKNNPFNIKIWLILMGGLFLASVCWQPQTKNISQKKQIIQNQLMQKIYKKDADIKITTEENIKTNQKINKIIFKQEIYKTIITSCVICYLTFENWQLFSNKIISISQTIMLSSITFNMIEVIWWLQHELSIWQVQLERFKTSLKQTQF